ncbi:hypothetical protein NDU88_005952 [Pleurodeles waltl]|uniref:Uncharacterized protein n=1 Tax=Pleurodeles waltl TaxID=8319 RepID=A0AAV7VP65_PLEWA|nr:hypothetical protein NDU88_005952 [Pleurodeles waltl]
MGAPVPSHIQTERETFPTPDPYSAMHPAGTGPRTSRPTDHNHTVLEIQDRNQLAEAESTASEQDPDPNTIALERQVILEVL